MPQTAKVRILHVITALTHGGAQTMLHKLIRESDPRRFTHAIVSLAGPAEMDAAFEDIAPIYHLNMHTAAGKIRWPLRLVRTIRQQRPDVLQTWLYHADLLGLVAGRVAGVGNVAWNVRCSYMGSQYTSPRRRLLLALLAFLSRFPDVIVCNSEAGMRWHSDLGYRTDRWRIIPNGFDTTLFRPNASARAVLRARIGLDVRTQLVGLIARYDAIKRHDIFIGAAKRVLDCNIDAHFALVGHQCDSDNQALVDLIKRTNHASRFHLLGEHSDIAAVTAALDIACCTSSGEGFPNIVGEAMSCGIPCVVTDVGDCASILGAAGLVVRRDDEAAFADGLMQMLSLPQDKRSEIGRRGRAIIERNYSLEAVLADYNDLYSELRERCARGHKHPVDH